jgi:3-deoxy-7-phosphoheptulonate synthase
MGLIVVMRAGAAPEEVRKVADQLEGMGLRLHISQGVERTVIGVIGGRVEEATAAAIEALEEVERVVPILEPYKLASRRYKEGGSRFDLGGGVEIGGEKVLVIAGPCAVESLEQMQQTARAVKAAGARLLRGGAFKPRTSPYSFQGMEREGLEILAQVRRETGLLITTEVMDPYNLEMVAEYADVVQIGTRNMQNFHLLREVGRIKKPVLLKRGMCATLEEWLMAAEYIMSGGNQQVILCERGIRTFDTYTRNTLDLTAVPSLKQLTHLPVVVDPSHGTGKWKLVGPMSRAAVAAGADGLLIEVHPHPEQAVSDGPQSLTPERFAGLMRELTAVASAVGRGI